MTGHPARTQRDVENARGWRDIKIAELTASLGAAMRDRDKLREAVTPSHGTKGAYSGEFHFNVVDRDDNGDEVYRRVLVPWTTIKEIMAAIAVHAALDVDHAG